MRSSAALPPLVAALPFAVAALIGGAAVACGVVLAVRRLSGGFGVADSAVAWLVTGAGIALVAVADQSSRRGGGVFGSVAARCGLVLGVVAVALPPRAGDWASILAVMAAAAVAVVRMPSGVTPRRTAVPPTRTAPQTHRDRPPRLSPAPVRRDDQVPGRLLQRLERFESPSGADCLRGRLHLALPAGSRAAHAHVGFCPSFTETPTVRVTTEYDGVEAVVSAAEVLPWGIRVECRLTEPAEEPLEIPIDVFVQASR
ncbi:MAG: hypothetical protein K8S94_11475 [Planctomycetia bacterium]|nr:hypothetical protein [Planctomycetia bacterium]